MNVKACGDPREIPPRAGESDARSGRRQFGSWEGLSLCADVRGSTLRKGEGWGTRLFL